MTAQKGALMLLKIGNGGTPTETFATLGGMRTTSMALNNQLIDATNRDSGAWRAILDGAGIRSLAISGSGIFTDAASEETLRAQAFANSVKNYELHFGNGDKFSGGFQIVSYQRSGNFDEEETYSLTLASSGAVTFTAG